MTTITGSKNAKSLRHERIMASAGSGKTFALTNRYLRLIFDHADPGSILGSTFTRLAAGEIRDRILSRLAEAAIDDSKRRELGRFIEQPKLGRDDASCALVSLTRQLHQLQIRTIDSFFAGIVRSFALELGIDPASQVVDEQTEKQLRREAIMLMLDERDPQPVIDLLRVLTEGSTGRSVTDDIDSLVSSLYDLYRDAPPEAWAAIDPAVMLRRDEVIEAAAALPDGDVGTPHKSVVKKHLEDCHRARSARYDSYEDWLAFITSGVAGAIMRGCDAYYGKPIPAELVRLYQPLLDHGLAVIRNSVVNRTRAMHDLLSRFHQRFEEVKAANKAMTFSDITWKAGQAEQLGTLDDICFRLDAKLRHVLLDEMQDTSIAQWRALQPIINELLAYAPPERSFFCVGDVKQSIYAWREGCPEILETLTEVSPAIHAAPQLVKSWRSSPVIMEVVNRSLTNVAANEAMAEYQQAAQQWDACFARHETAKTDMPGYAELRTVARAGENQKQWRVRLTEAAELIRQLHAQGPDCEIGVLTRTNKTVNFLLYELGPSRLNVPSSGRGGGNLTDSAAVNAVLDLLRLADHPEHKIAAFNVMHSPLGEEVGLKSMRDCRRVSRLVRRRVLDDGYAATIQQWVRVIGAFTDARQFRRLVQLQQLAADFDQNPTANALRCDAFVAMAESTTVDDPSATPVQVMTVHRSKGLEFDIVVLPELGGWMVRGTPTMLYSRDGAAGPIQCVARHLNAAVTAMIPELAAMQHEHVQRTARESLCLLYVAMTRAKHALHMLIDPPKDNESKLPKTHAGFLRCALADGDIEPGQVLFEAGDPRWHENVETPKSAPADSPVASDPNVESAQGDNMVKIALAPSRGSVARGRTSASASAGKGDDQPLAVQLHIPRADARERGSVIHALFEQVEWLENWTPDREALLRLARLITPRRDDAWLNQQVDAFLDMLHRRQIKAALSRGEAAGESLALWREYPFARLVDGLVQRGYIDRLVARYVDGNAVEATVMDFKTDDIPAEAVSERAKLYRPQLEAYRAAAASALGIDNAAISMTLLFVTCGEVVRL